MAKKLQRLEINWPDDMLKEKDQRQAMSGGDWDNGIDNSRRSLRGQTLEDVAVMTSRQLQAMTRPPRNGRRGKAGKGSSLSSKSKGEGSGGNSGNQTITDGGNRTMTDDDSVGGSKYGKGMKGKKGVMGNPSSGQSLSHTPSSSPRPSAPNMGVKDGMGMKGKKGMMGDSSPVQSPPIVPTTMLPSSTHNNTERPSQSPDASPPSGDKTESPTKAPANDDEPTKKPSKAPSDDEPGTDDDPVVPTDDEVEPSAPTEVPGPTDDEVEPPAPTEAPGPTDDEVEPPAPTPVPDGPTLEPGTPTDDEVEPPDPTDDEVEPPDPTDDEPVPTDDVVEPAEPTTSPIPDGPTLEPGTYKICHPRNSTIVPCPEIDLAATCDKYNPDASFSSCFEKCKASFCCIHDSEATRSLSCSKEYNCNFYKPCYIVWFKLHDTIGPAPYIRLKQSEPFYNVNDDDFNQLIQDDPDFYNQFLGHHFMTDDLPLTDETFVNPDNW